MPYHSTAGIVALFVYAYYLEHKRLGGHGSGRPVETPARAVAVPIHIRHGQRLDRVGR